MGKGNCWIKAEAVGNRVEGEKIIIAADTIVTYMGKILHRPFKEEEAGKHVKNFFRTQAYGLYGVLPLCIRTRTENMKRIRR